MVIETQISDEERKNALVIGTSLEIGECLIKKNYFSFVISKGEWDNSRYLKHYSCDITNLEKTKEILNEIKSLDCIVFAQRYRGEDSRKEYELMVEIPCIIIDYLISTEKLNKNCSIIFMGSDASYTITKQNINYHLSRAGIIQMVKYYANKLANTSAKIRVNCISPCKINKGYINSDFINKIPLKRMCEKKDIYKTINFLNQCGFITGQNIILDGGSSLSLRLYDKGEWKKIISYDNHTYK